MGNNLNPIYSCGSGICRYASLDFRRVEKGSKHKPPCMGDRSVGGWAESEQVIKTGW